jgi:hypothetical protein
VIDAGVWASRHRGYVMITPVELFNDVLTDETARTDHQNSHSVDHPQPVKNPAHGTQTPSHHRTWLSQLD